MKKSRLFAILAGMAVLSFSLFNSCEIGLGESVDTEAPSLSINNPPTSAVVRDAFAISGTWSDDGSIDKISVELKNTGTDQKFSYSGTLDGGRWYCNVDPKKAGAEIKDGKYEATVTIKDNGGHSTTSTRAFIIDNTAPVIVLQRPSTKAQDDDSDLFGQNFTLTGQAADDNNVKKIRVIIYSDPECTVEKHHVDITNVPPTISLDVAKFVAGEVNDYSKIYGSANKDGKKQFYCSIVAYDEAQRYPVSGEQTEADKLGNPTNTYYLYNEIGDILADYKVTELYSIMSGTFTTSDTARAADATNIPAKLSSKVISNGRFSLNPANNPEFKVVGREGLAKDGSAFTNPSNSLANGEPISVKVDVGLDAITLVKESLRPYLLPSDANAKATVADIPENRIYPKLGDKPYEVSGTGYTFTTKITSDECVNANNQPVTLTVGENYIIGMEGKDTKGNEVVAEDGKVFGFRLAPSGAAPIVDIKTCVNPGTGDNASVNNFTSDSMIYVPRYKPEVSPAAESVIRFTGTVDVEDGTPVVEMKIDNGTAQIIPITAVAGQKGEFTFTKDVPVSSFSEPAKPNQHNIVFLVTQTQQTKVTKSIMYQPDAPTVTLSRVEPTAYNYPTEDGIPEKITKNGVDYTKKYLNGKNVKLNITIIAGSVGLNEKDADKKAKIEFIQNGVVKKTIASPTFGETDFIDTTEFAEGELLIRITAYDMAGNKTVCEDTYYVKQDTDIPVILPKNSGDATVSNTKADVETIADESKNIFSSNQTVLYKLIDDDGLVQASYSIYKVKTDNSLEQVGETKVLNKLNNTNDYQIEVTMPESPAIYKVVLDTKDSNSLNSTGTAQKSMTKEFFVRVTASAPKIDEITLDSTIYNGTQTINPTIKISSDQIPFTLKREVKDSSGNIIDAFTQIFTKDDAGMSDLNTESPTITDSIQISPTISNSGNYKSGSYKIIYTVKDKNLKTNDNEASKTVKVDLDAPNISAVKLAGEAYNNSKWYNSKTLALEVTAADVSGELEKVEYSTDNSLWTSLSKKTENGVIKYSGSAVFNNEGAANTLYICATDKAGNVTCYDGTTANGMQPSDLQDRTAYPSVTAKIDTSAPNLSAKFFKKGNEDPVAKQNSIYVKKDTKLTVYGNYDDLINGTTALSGVGELAVTLPQIKESTATIKYSTTPIGNTVADIPADTNFKNYSEITDKTAIRAWKAEFTPKDSGEFSLIGSDLVYGAQKNTTTSLKVFDITYDETAPEINLSRFQSTKTGETEAHDVYQNINNNKYYIDNRDKILTITGTATDTIGTDSVNLEITKKNTTTKLATITNSGTVGQWKFTGINLQSWGGTGADAVITVKDKAGNTNSLSLDIVFDITAPVTKHELDDKNKDLYFRIGTYANDADIDVGGKYQIGTFGNTTSLTVRGYFADEENGSDINQYYYKVYTDVSDITGKTDTQLIEDVVFHNTGTFKTLSTNSKAVEFNVEKTNPDTDYNALMEIVNGSDSNNPDGIAFVKLQDLEPNGKQYYQFRKNIKSNFKTSISNLSEGNNYVVIVAEDNAGNRSVDSIPQSATSSTNNNYYSLNVDSTQPVISSVTGNATTKTSDVALTVSMTEEHPATPEVVIKKKSGTVVTLPKPTITSPEGSNSSYTSTVTIPFSNSELQDDTYTIEIRAKDKAGNLSDPVTKTVIKDNVKPAIAFTQPATSSTTTSSTTFIHDTSYTFKGTITERNDITEVKAILYQITGSTETERQSVDITPKRRDTGDDWDWSWPVYGLDASDYKITVRAKDNTGNEFVSPPSPVIKIDNTKPVLTITATGLKDAEGNIPETLTSRATYYATTSYSITVEVDDVNYEWSTSSPLQDVTSKKGKVSNSDFTTEDATTSTVKAFKITPKNTITDETYTFTINVEDKAGNPADELTIKVQRDTTPPAVEIQTPVSEVIDGTKYSFRVSATDSGVGVDELSYAFTQSSTAPTQESSWTIDPDFTDGVKIIEKDLSETTNSVAGKLCEGEWWLHVKAKDRSGNGETMTPVSKKFIVDLNKPELRIDGLTENATNVLSSEVGTNGYKLDVNVTDTYALHSTTPLIVKVGGTEISKTNGEWIIPTGNSAGQLKANTSVKVELTAKDKVNKETPKTYWLYYDTEEPDLTVTAPGETEAVEVSTKAVKGTVVDGGYGVAKVEYTLYRGLVTASNAASATKVSVGGKIVNSTNFPVEVKGEQWAIKRTDVAENSDLINVIPLGEEGQLTLEVKATEKTITKGSNTYGGRSKTVYVPFYYDAENPVLDELEVKTTGKTTNEAFTLGGKVYDTNQLQKIEIKCGDQTWVAGLATGNDSNVILEKAISNPSANNWTASFVVGTETITNTTHSNKIADGTKLFTITAYDIAGKKTQITRTVTIDTVSPTVSSPAITNAKTWYNTRTLSITGTATDTNGTGVKTVEYRTTEDGAWNAITINGGAYSGSIPFDSDGSGKQIIVRATDGAGNTAENTLSSIQIDTKAPEFVENTTQIKTNATDATNTIITFDVTEENSGIQASDIEVYLNNTKLTLTTAAAGDADVTNNRISVGTATGSGSSKKYPVTLQIGKTTLASLEGSYSVKAVIKDIAGNSSSSTTVRTISVDKDAPVPSFTSHGANATVNKTITLKGAVTDESNSAIKSITLKAECGTTTKNYAYPAGAEGADGDITYSNGQWSIDINTSEFNDTTTAKNLKLSLTATDDYDNTNTAVTRTLSIDQNSDRPVVKFTNLVKEGSDYILKYGNAATLEGTITDDDSESSKVVNKFFASKDPITNETDWSQIEGTNEWTRETDFIKTYKWENVKDETNATSLYYTALVLSNKATSATDDEATVYTDIESFKWKDVKATASDTNKYYTDVALTTEAIKAGENVTNATSDDTTVYQHTGFLRTFKWKNVKAEKDENAASIATDLYFTTATISTEATSSTANSANVYRKLSEKTEFNVSTGDYKYTPADPDDGTKEVYFYVKDCKDEVFYTTYSTGTTADLKRPYQQFKTDPKADNKIALAYNSDSNAPTINASELITITPDDTDVYRSYEWKEVKNETDAATNYYTDKALTTHPITTGDSVTANNAPVYRSFKWSAVKAETGAKDNYFIDKALTRKPEAESALKEWTVGGKSRNLLQLKVSANDGNGIQKIDIKVGNTTYSSTNSSDGTVKTPVNNSGNYVFTTNKIDISSTTNFPEGEVPVTVLVYDNSGLYSNQKTSFYVDRTAPSIDISTPSSDGLTYYGTIKQNVAAGIITGGDSDTKVYFTVSESNNLTDFIGEDMTSSVGVSASIVFDGRTGSENGYHTDNLHDWVAALKGPSYNIDENDDNVPVYIWYKAVDTCGNFSVEKRLVNVIPNGDKPTVTISYPENKEDSGGNKTVIPAIAGTIRLYGTTDIKAYNVDSVYVQLAQYPHYKWEDVKDEDDSETKYWTDIAMTKHPLKTAIEATENTSAKPATLDTDIVYYFPSYTWSTVKNQANARSKYYTSVVNATHPDSTTLDSATVYTLCDWDDWRNSLKAMVGDIVYNSTYANSIVEIPGHTGVYGLKTSGTADNWNLPINTLKEFETKNPGVAIRVYAISDSGKNAAEEKIHKLSDPTDQLFMIDATAPRIGGDDKSPSRYSLQLVQFKSGKTGQLDQIENRVAYKSDMWVKGNWYLLASVYDDQTGISSITLDEHKNAGIKKFEEGTETTVGTGDDKRTKYTIKTFDAKDAFAIQTEYKSGAYNYNICIPLPTGSDSGTVTYTIEATEKSEQNLSCVETVRINYDNTAPKISTNNHTKYDMKANIQQSDGFYNLKGFITDADGNATVSGISGVAFYFMRRGTASTNPVTKVYDPMWKDKSVAVRTGNTDAENIEYSHGLYWKKKTGVTRDENNLNQITLSAADDNIHAGGLALLGGTIYRISSVNGAVIEVEGEVPLTVTDAYFALALVVDNFRAESTTGRTLKNSASDADKYGYGYYGPGSGDDGDLMEEYIDGTSVEGQWQAKINSKNIPDGPIELHYVAFDKSQNFTVGIVGNVNKTTYNNYKTKDVTANKAITTATEDTTNKLASEYYYSFTTAAYISNNAPRIAGVTVGTDYNGNGTVEAGEKQTKYVAQKTVQFNGVATEVAGNITDLFIASGDNTANGAAMMALKGASSVEVEIVGGNGAMYYQYSIDGNTYKDHATIDAITTGSGKFVQNKTAMSITRETEGLANDADYQANYYKSTTLPAINFTENDLATAITENTEKTWFTFEFWDSTEETTKFVNSQYAQLKLPVSIQVHDTTAPNTVISPLYWKSSTDNSIYSVNDTLYGHVELKDDLGTSVLGTTYGKTDDKVSGVVVFRGYAYDNKRLSEIEWAIVSSAGNSILPNNANDISYTTGATFNGTWTGTSSFDIWTAKKGYAKDTVVFETSTKKFYKCSTAHTSGTTFDATNWSVDTSNHYKFTVKTEPVDDSDIFNKDGTEAYLDAKGHKVYWELIVDTSAINGTVAKDAKLYVRAKDASGNDGTEGKLNTQYTDMTATGSPRASDKTQEAKDKATKAPTYQVDIVPYITGVETYLSGENATSLQSRTARGYYPVLSTETVTFTGYNLSGAKYVKAQSNSVDTLVDMTDGKLAVSNITTSGKILLRVGSLYSINNMNNNDATGNSGNTVTDALIRAGTVTYNTIADYAYNRKPNSSINNTLTDDVVFDVWTINSKAALPESAGMINEPVMRINPANGRIGFAFVNGPAYFSMPSGNNDVNGTNNSYTRWQRNYDDFAGVSFVYDAQGNVHATTIGRDVESNLKLAGKFTYITSKWGACDLNNSDDNYKGDQKIRLETIGLPSGVVVNGTALSAPVLDKTRIRSPSIAVANNTTYTYKANWWDQNDTQGTYQTIYMAYYDNLQKQVRFRWARAGNRRDDTLADDNNRSERGQFTEHNGNSGGTTPDRGVNEAHASEYSVVAGVDYEIQSFSYPGNAVATPGEEGTYYGYDTGSKAGEYVSLAVIENTTTTAEDDVVVLVWYDGTNCLYSYKVNPCNDNDAGNTRVNENKAGTNGYWSTPKVIFENAGEYCKIAVGNDGSIHIAAATVKAQLMYAYMSSYSDTSNIKTSLVDAEGLTGTHIGLDTIVSDNGHVVPYISCYMQSSGKSKIAYLLDSATSVDYDAEGCNSSGVFTGLWEVSIVPTTSRLTADNINVAFYKETTGTNKGKAKAIPSGTNTAGGSNVGANTTIANYGTTYGNNTKNPVVAYVVQSGTNGNIETAQKK